MSEGFFCNIVETCIKDCNLFDVSLGLLSTRFCVAKKWDMIKDKLKHLRREKKIQLSMITIDRTKRVQSYAFVKWPSHACASSEDEKKRKEFFILHFECYFTFYFTLVFDVTDRRISSTLKFLSELDENVKPKEETEENNSKIKTRKNRRGIKEWRNF